MGFLKPRTNDNTRRRLGKRMMAMTLGTMMMLTALSGIQAMHVGAEESLPLPRRDGRTVLYVMDEADLKLTDDQAQHINQINYAFALLEDGRANGDHWVGVKELESFLRRHEHIDGVVSVGGWGAEGFSDACATEEGRAVLAESILQLMDKHGFVGVDIDWEYPGSSAAGIVSREEDEENWYELLRILRQGLDERQAATGRDHLLSVAIGGGQAQLDRVDGERLGELVDQAVIMAYDLKGAERITGHHAGLYPDGNTPDSGAYAVKRLTDSGLFAGKILLGIPSYGRMWRQVGNSTDGLNARAATPGNKYLRYDEILALEKNGYIMHYDDQAQAAWWFDGTNFVSGESAQSIQYKADWLRDNGLLGAAVWAQHQDPEGVLMATLDAALTDHFSGEGGEDSADTQEND